MILTEQQPTDAMTPCVRQASQETACRLVTGMAWTESQSPVSHAQGERLFHQIIKLTSEPDVCLLAGCFMSLQNASVSQGRICSDNCTCCHTEKKVADQTGYLTQSQYSDTGPTSHGADPIRPGVWQGSLWKANI